MSFFLILLGGMLLLDVGAIAFCWRMARQGQSWWGWIGVGFAVLQLVAFVLIILARRGDRGRLDFTTVGWSSIYNWHFFGLALIGFMLLGTAVIRVWQWVAGVAPDPGRRAFLGSAAALVPVAFNVGLTAASLFQLPRFRIRRFDLPIPDLPAALDGLTLAHVSDLHVGEFTHGRVLADIIRQTNDLRADLICITGDIINHALADLPVAMHTIAAMRAEFGVWTVEGNHDLIEDGPAFERSMRESGLNFLLRESAQVEVRGHRVQLLGAPWTPRRANGYDEAMAGDVRQVLTLREPGCFPILLGHHPHIFDEAARAGLPLILAGHTHGGQIMLTETIGFGPAIFRYWSGIYRRAASTLVVSNGVGDWFPLRLNAPAEIVHLTLRTAQGARSFAPPAGRIKSRDLLRS